MWLQRAGYATGVVGKYLNGYGSRDRFEVPPGWTEFDGLLGGDTYRFYGYTLSRDGRLQHLRERAGGLPDRRDHRPLGRASCAAAPRRGPRSSCGRPTSRRTPGARTTPAIPPAGRRRCPPRAIARAFLGVPPPRPPSFDEADVSDKPFAIRRRPRLGDGGIARVAEAWRRRQASLLSVDEGVARIVDALRDGRRAARTRWWCSPPTTASWRGEHRVPAGKLLPYEPSIRVPLLMRGPGVPAGVTRRAARLERRPGADDRRGGGRARRVPQRRPLAAALRPPGRPPRRPRAAPGGPAAAPLERPAALHGRADGRAPSTSSTWAARGELYDLAADPYELDNLAGTAAARPLRSRLRARARAAPRLRRRLLPLKLGRSHVERTCSITCRPAGRLDGDHARRRLARRSRARRTPPTRAACGPCAARR